MYIYTRISTLADAMLCKLRENRAAHRRSHGNDMWIIVGV